MNIQATGYIIAPNVLGGKTSLRSFLSAPEVSFEVFDDYVDLEPQSVGGVADPDPEAHIFDDLATEDSYAPSQKIGVDSFNNMQELLSADASKGNTVALIKDKHASDYVGERGSNYSKNKKTFMRNSEGKLIPVNIKSSKGQGETVYDSRFAEVLFNISTNKE